METQARRQNELCMFRYSKKEEDDKCNKALRKDYNTTEREAKFNQSIKKCHLSDYNFN